MDRNQSLWLPFVIIGVILFAVSIMAIPLIWDKHRKLGKAFMIAGSMGLALILITLSQYILNTFNYVWSSTQPHSRPLYPPNIFSYMMSYGWSSLILIGIIGLAAARKHPILKTIFMTFLVLGVLVFAVYVFAIIIAPFL